MLFRPTLFNANNSIRVFSASMTTVGALRGFSGFSWQYFILASVRVINEVGNIWVDF